MKVPEAIIDAIIAAALIVMGVLMMSVESLLTSGFDSHISGIAMGTGIGWIVKSYMVRAKQSSPIVLQG